MTWLKIDFFILYHVGAIDIIMKSEYTEELKELIPLDIFYTIIEYLNPETLRGISRFIDSVVEYHYLSVTNNPDALRFLKMLNMVEYKHADEKINFPIEKNTYHDEINIHFGPDEQTENIVSKYIKRYENKLITLMVSLASLKVDKCNIVNVHQYKQDIIDEVRTLIYYEYHYIAFRDLEKYHDHLTMKLLCEHVLSIYHMFLAMCGIAWRFKINDVSCGWKCDYCPFTSYTTNDKLPCGNCDNISLSEIGTRYQSMFNLRYTENAFGYAGDEQCDANNLLGEYRFNWFMTR